MIAGKIDAAARPKAKATTEATKPDRFSLENCKKPEM